MNETKLHTPERDSGEEYHSQVFHNYFAYGLNLSKNRNTNWDKIGNGELAGFQWIINDRGVATLTKNEKSVTWGAVFRIDQNDLNKLDKFEGYPIYYNRVESIIRCNGSEITCWLYADGITRVGRPRNGYLQSVIGGAIEQELPGSWVEELRGWQPREMSHDAVATTKDWIRRAKQQVDPHAKFFMLYVAAMVSQGPGDKEWEKMRWLGEMSERIYTELKASPGDSSAIVAVDSAIQGMEDYIMNSRSGQEIQNLNEKPPKNTPKETSFMKRQSNKRILNALKSMTTVRNNLFHGDKRAYSQNDIHIIEHCNNILEAVLVLVIRRPDTNI